MYFVAEGAAATFERLGFPGYFRIELGVAKILGALALVSPLPRWMKEWTYAGFTITFVSAVTAHLAAGDPLTASLPPAVSLVVLLTSYGSYHRYYRGVGTEPQSAKA
jgi:hypothetical protein